jgi:hypothetical protein
MLRRFVGIIVLGFCITTEAVAQLSGADRAAIKKMTQGSLYLRNNLPCPYTSGIGLGTEAVTEVSPTGVDWNRNVKEIQESNQRGRAGGNTVYWGFGPNDMIQYGKLYFRSGGVVELSAQGAKPKNLEVWIRFVGIHSREDFKKAYDLILSPKPLQDEHPEWPAEIRTAIGERRVVIGMTKTQVFAVVGTPVNIETGDGAGSEIETWFPRQDTAMPGVIRLYAEESGFHGPVVLSGVTGFPISLRFVDGKLSVIDDKSAKPARDK